MSLSKIIRHAKSAPTVFIGERHFDAVAEGIAEKKLKKLFPVTSLVTTPEGGRLIPISEVHYLEKRLREECESTRQQGYEQGFKQGLDKGLDEARDVLANFEKAIGNAIGQREMILEEAKDHILELVIKISKKVTFDALEIDREAAVSMIENVINQLVDRSSLKIKVHPDYLPIMEQNMDRFLSNSTAIKELTFEADPRVKEGGCFIETPTGDIDARLQSQFEVIANALKMDEEQN